MKPKNDSRCGKKPNLNNENILVIPRAIIRRIAMEMIKKKPKFIISRVDKKAIDILHFETEKYIAEVFMISGHILDVSDRSTLQSLIFKKAVQLHDIFHTKNS